MAAATLLLQSSVSVRRLLEVINKMNLRTQIWQYRRGCERWPDRRRIQLPACSLNTWYSTPTLAKTKRSASTRSSHKKYTLQISKLSLRRTQTNNFTQKECIKKKPRRTHKGWLPACSHQSKVDVDVLHANYFVCFQAPTLTNRL